MHSAFASAAPLRRGALRQDGLRNRCSCSPVMVLDSVSARAMADQQRNARLGINNLWAGPQPVRSFVQQSVDGVTDEIPLALKENTLQTVPFPVDAATSLQVPVVGDGSPTSRAVLPWDTTTGAHGITYLQRRMTFARRRKAVLDKSYEECKRITSLFSKTFFMGCNLLSPRKRRAVYAIYTWCRRTDDLVDGPRVQQRADALHNVLLEWGVRLDDVFDRGIARDALDLALADCVSEFPDLTPRPFHDMIAGMRMDIEQDRFATFDDLYLYCYRVAGTVGLMTLPIIGANEPGRAGLSAASDAALALGVALQLTNILRDVGEDHLRGRIYLPLEDLQRFNYSEADLENCVVDDRYRALMRFQIERARSYFRKAEEGISLLSPDARLPVRASLDMYSKILDVLEENGYNNFTKRAYVSKLGKLASLPISWMRVQDGMLWAKAADFLDKFNNRKSF